MKIAFDDYYTLLNFANHHKDVNRMGNYTKIKLLFLSMIVFLMSFTSKDEESDLPSDVVTYINTGTINYYTFSLAPSIDLKKLANIRLSEMFGDDANAEFKAKLSKQRKKCKRLLNNLSSNIQPPVKEIDPLIFNIFWKDTYSKPHFLSHIHSFVFRLTPF